MRVKAHCSECGQSIYDNVEAGGDILCSTCIAKKVGRVENLEERFGNEIKTGRFSTPMESKYKPMGIIRNKEDYQLAMELEKEEAMDRITGKALEKARKRKKLSQKTLAIYLGVSPGNLCQQEKGLIPLTTKALAFINDGFKW